MEDCRTCRTALVDWQNCLFAGRTILAVPSFRDRVPVVVDDVRITTLTGPGELIDVIVTERGIVINPKRQDQLNAVKDQGLSIRTIEDIKAEVERMCGGKPAKPLGDRPVAVVKWVDRTLLDTVWQVLEDNPYAATKASGGEWPATSLAQRGTLLSYFARTPYYFRGSSAALSFTSSGTNLGWAPSNCLAVARLGPHVVSRSSLGFEPLEKI
jgi:hypothetical protein